MATVSCSGCVFGDFDGGPRKAEVTGGPDVPSEERVGICRRRPPTITDYNPDGGFPKINEKDWCGEAAVRSKAVTNA